MNIEVIFTGGTIGSMKNENGDIAPSKNQYRIIQMYEESNTKRDVTFITSKPFTILSENLCSDNILKLITCIKNVLKKSDINKTEGIIITHGTDTIQYEAAILSYVFGAAKLPVILVSSDYILDDRRSNGLDNFKYAVEFIAGHYGKGVFVSHRNSEGRTDIIRGTRMSLPIAYSSDMNSDFDSYYGCFIDGRFIKNAFYRVYKDNIPAMFPEDYEIKLSDTAKSIVRIRPYVGMEYPILSKDTKAVLFETFHSGTIPVNDLLEEFCRQAVDMNIPMFLTGVKENESCYETVGMAEKLGINILKQTSVISQYCKLWLAVSNGLDVNEIMNISISEDFI